MSGPLDLAGLKEVNAALQDAAATASAVEAQSTHFHQNFDPRLVQVKS